MRIGLLVILIIGYCQGKKDSNNIVGLAELMYLSELLSEDECWRLTTALRADTLMEMAEPIDGVTCLDNLVNWMSNVADEDPDISEAVLAHKLRQIGRKDLAEWVALAVTAEPTDNGVDSVGNDALNSKLIRGVEAKGVSWDCDQSPSPPPPLTFSCSPYKWTLMDFILSTLLLVTAIATLWCLLAVAIWRFGRTFHRGWVYIDLEGVARR